jgi:hypothetical protein
MAAALLTQQQLANELQVSVRTLERWRQEGIGLAFIHVGHPATDALMSMPGWNNKRWTKGS